jgi:hypothetical protein
MFTAPDRFDLQRPQADHHLALGHGLHYCLGAPLARLEARIAIAVLVQRLPTLHLVPGQTITYLPSLLNRALQHLEVRWGTESSKGHCQLNEKLLPDAFLVRQAEVVQVAKIEVIVKEENER